MLEAGLGLGWGHSGPQAILLQEGDFEPRGREGVRPAPPSPRLAWRPRCALRTAPPPLGPASGPRSHLISSAEYFMARENQSPPPPGVIPEEHQRVGV